MKLRSYVIFTFVALVFLLGLNGTQANGTTILYVPQDDRPVSLSYTVSTAQDAGYTVLTPPSQYISGSNFHGEPDLMWLWVRENVSKADILVLSTDSLIYGGLVDSRKHNIPLSVLQKRTQQIIDLKKSYPSTPFYAFGTVMRSPRASGGGVEPPYYSQFGPTIFQIAALQDKLDGSGLTDAEMSQLFTLTATVPSEYLRDWFDRRRKNMIINQDLINATKNNVLTYFALGHDDTSYLSQSALESRYLQKFSKGISPKIYGSFPGADQLGLLLIARAHVDLHHLQPTFETIYPLGGGPETIPHYEDQTVGKTIAEHIVAVGGKSIQSGRPDILLAINTPLSTVTGESEAFDNFFMISPSTQRFVERIEQAANQGMPVSVADISYSNGSDNILMGALKSKGLLFKLDAYNGWNTASNTVGYAIAQGILGLSMTPEKHENMLIQQYLDNWGYQANVRKEVYRKQKEIRTDNVKYTAELDPALEPYMNTLIKNFAEKQLGVNPDRVSAKFPWERLFETDITVYDSALPSDNKTVTVPPIENERISDIKTPEGKADSTKKK